MSLFAHVKKKENEFNISHTENTLSIKVLGLGCATCHKQLEYAEKAVRDLGLNIAVEYVTDLEKITSYGVMSMPAVVIDEKVVSYGKVIKPDEIKRLLKGGSEG